MIEKGIKFFWCRGEEFKNRIFELYGVTHISKNNEIKERKILTCLKNYGVKYPSQNSKIKEKQEETTISLSIIIYFFIFFNIFPDTIFNK